MKSRKRQWVGHVARIWDRRDAYRVFVGKPERKRLRRRTRCRWEDNIKIDFTKVEYVGVDWIDLAQHRDAQWALVRTVISLRLFIKFAEFVD
jgi:hypothetical protein